jgi:hypothetical protein
MLSARLGSVKYLLPLMFICLGFAGGWEAQRYLGVPRPRLQRLIPPGVVKRCGDPNERACAATEVSDNQLRMFCMEGKLTGDWMRDHGFDAHERTQRPLSAGEQQTLVASLRQHSPL